MIARLRELIFRRHLLVAGSSSKGVVKLAPSESPAERQSTCKQPAAPGLNAAF